MLKWKDSGLLVFKIHFNKLPPPFIIAFFIQLSYGNKIEAS